MAFLASHTRLLCEYILAVYSKTAGETTSKVGIVRNLYEPTSLLIE